MDNFDLTEPGAVRKMSSGPRKAKTTIVGVLLDNSISMHTHAKEATDALEAFLGTLVKACRDPNVVIVTFNDDLASCVIEEAPASEILAGGIIGRMRARPDDAFCFGYTPAMRTLQYFIKEILMKRVEGAAGRGVELRVSLCTIFDGTPTGDDPDGQFAVKKLLEQFEADRGRPMNCKAIGMFPDDSDGGSSMTPAGRHKKIMNEAGFSVIPYTEGELAKALGVFSASVSQGQL